MDCTRRWRPRKDVKIERENQTLATVTFQNYFRMYKKLAGMTGTAETEAAEFDKIYKLEVVVIPTNREMMRVRKLRRGVSHGEGKILCGGRRDHALRADRAAGAGGHHVGREVGAAL